MYILVLFLTKTIVNLNNLIQDHCNSNTIAKKKLSKSFAYLFLVLYFIHKSFFYFFVSQGHSSYHEGQTHDESGAGEVNS